MGKEYRLAGVQENTPEQSERAAALFREYFPDGRRELTGRGELAAPGETRRTVRPGTKKSGECTAAKK